MKGSVVPCVHVHAMIHQEQGITTKQMEFKDKDQQQHRDQQKIHQEAVRQGVNASILGHTTLLLTLHQRHKERMEDLVMATASDGQGQVPPWTVESGRHYK